jgi:PAS domain-containing protein
MSKRPSREVTVGDRSLTLIDASRSATGLGLAYFIAPDRADDRRAVLEPGVDVADLDDEAAAELWSGAAPLTQTERRFSGPNGEAWLAQSTGPVWGEGAAAGITGLRLVCLTAERGPVEAHDVNLGSLDDEGLADLIGPAS